MTPASTAPGSRAPGPILLWSDYPRSIAELLSLGATWRQLATAPRADAHPVLVLPGIGTSDIATVPLRRYLTYLGYRAYGWHLGRNIGPTAAAVEGMRIRLAQIHERHDEQVTIVGWSLGGIYARQLARRSPELVRQVITLGSPIKLRGHRQSNARRLFRYYAPRHAERLQLPLEQGLGALPVPTSSFYSRLDGVVAWQACLDTPGHYAENIEVYASHFGFCHHPAVLWAIADRLALPAEQWEPFRPPSWGRLVYATPKQRHGFSTSP